MLVGNEHLAEGFIVVQVVPGLLDGLNVFSFGDGGAQSIWCAKIANVLWIVVNQMLAWKRETVRMNTACLEDDMVLMKTELCGIHLGKCGVGEIHSLH